MKRKRKFDPAGATEGAAALGVSPARFRRLRDTDPRFPAPAKELAMGDVWDLDDLAAYNVIRKGPGRPKKTD